VPERIYSCCAVGCNLSLKLHFGISICNSPPLPSPKIWQVSPKYMVKSSMKVLPELKSGKVENGAQMCWLTAAAVLYGRHQLKKMRSIRRLSQCLINIIVVSIPYGARGNVVVEALRYKPDGVTGYFLWHKPSGRTMALGSTQVLTEISTRNISWGLRRPVHRDDNLATFICRLS
jgi:hypothetical protein